MSEQPQPNPVPAPTPPVTDDPVAAAKAEAAGHWDKYLRAVADLDNYRKRVRREKDELAQFTREHIINALLPALDNLERALDHSPEGTPLHEGLLQVQKQFQTALADFGLVELIAKPGVHFDPNLHEAVSHIESGQHPDGVVIEQLQSGYKLGDKLLRPVRVTVSKGPGGTGVPACES